MEWSASPSYPFPMLPRKAEDFPRKDIYWDMRMGQRGQPLTLEWAAVCANWGGMRIPLICFNWALHPQCFIKYHKNTLRSSLWLMRILISTVNGSNMLGGELQSTCCTK